MNPLTWIRAAVRNACRGGVQDFVDEMAADPAVLSVRVNLPALADTQPEVPAVTDQPEGTRARSRK